MEPIAAHQAQEKKRGESAGFDLSDRSLYINRELSWLRFNDMVLEEALDESHPLLERVKFLSITGTNLDEFFMVRVSGLRRQLNSLIYEKSVDGMTPAEQLNEIRNMLTGFMERQSRCWYDDILPKLKAAGIPIRPYVDLGKSQRARLRTFFENEIFPVLTPLAFDTAHPFPHISNLSLNLAVVVKERQRKKEESFARLKVPDSLPRFLQVPPEETPDTEMIGIARPEDQVYVLLEEVIMANLDMLFPELKVVSAYPFRVTRDADFEIEEDEAGDLMTTVKEQVEMRYFGSTIRLEVDDTMPDRIRNILIKNLDIEPFFVYTVKGMVGLRDLMQFIKIDRPDLKDRPFIPGIPKQLAEPGNIFSTIRKNNILTYQPYHSFNPVVEFISQAAKDPDVLAIKMTLYRTGNNPVIFDALMDARREGKQVAVVLELKARFDEETNISWARSLEEEGVHVVYGVIGMKVHAKMCLVVRREGDCIVRYVHLSTGNYNPVTSRIYADLGFFTTDPSIGADATDLFNALTGYSAKGSYRSLLVAPRSLRDDVLRRIEREIERQKNHQDGYLAIKMNALVDRKIIQTLYQASQAGVKIDLQIRGICCLRPGIPGVSENITVTSVVGRFLEHARIYYFRNGGEDEIFLGSADMMPRNLDRRVEILFPITEKSFKEKILQDILLVHLRDNVKARRLRSNGTYERVSPSKGEERIDSQTWLIERFGTWIN